MVGMIQKFIIVPVCSVYDKGVQVNELQMKPMVHYVGQDLDIKKLAAELEETANGEFFSKVNSEEANNKRRSTNRKDSRKV